MLQQLPVLRTDQQDYTQCRTADRQSCKTHEFSSSLGLLSVDLKFSKVKCPQEKSKGNNWEVIVVQHWKQYMIQICLNSLKWLETIAQIPILLKTHCSCGKGTEIKILIPGGAGIRPHRGEPGALRGPHPHATGGQCPTKSRLNQKHKESPCHCSPSSGSQVLSNK